MTATDPLSFEGAAARIGRTINVIAVLGTAGGLLVGGWKTGGGFLLGALISGLNYHWLHKLVVSLGAGARPRYRSVILGFRYLILGGGAYVIVKLSSIRVTAVLAGLFVLTAALFVEVIFEIVYARK